MKILSDLQQKVLKKLFSADEIHRHFYLTGGTALAAFYFQHRYSDDLDLFTHDVSLDSIERVVEDILRDVDADFKCQRRSPTFRRYLIDSSLQLDLVRDVDFRVGSPQLIDNIMVDTKKNIAVNKVTALYGRLDPKDYVDLYFLLKEGEFDILELLRIGKNKDAGLDPFQWAKVIADVHSISILPKMIIKCDVPELKTFFSTLRDKVTDSVKPSVR